MKKDNVKKPIRIGIDGRVMQEPHPSGIPLYAINTISEILRLDKKNQYIIFYNSFRNIRKELPIFEGNIETRLYRIPNKFLEWIWNLISYPKVDKILNTDVFFSPHFLKIPLSKDVKRVTTIHDLSFLRNKNYFSWRKNFWHWHNNPKKKCMESKIIIADSQSTKNDIVNFYKVKPEKIVVIPNGVKKKEYSFSKEEEEERVLKKFGLAKKNYIMFLSTLEPRKNIEGIIEAFFLLTKKKDDYKLVVAGKNGWLFKKIFAKVKKYKLDKSILFPGFVKEFEKKILLKNAKLFSFPSFCEGFGQPLLEANKYNISTITSAVSSMPEVVKDSAIIINPHIISDIAEGFYIIIKNENLRNVLEKKQKKISINSWKNTAKKTLDCLIS